MEQTLGDGDRDEIILEVARLIWHEQITVAEFYAALGIELDHLPQSNPGKAVGMIAGIFTGWANPPMKRPPQVATAGSASMSRST